MDLYQENQVVLYQFVGLLEVFQVQEALETILIMSITVRSQETLFRKFAKRLWNSHILSCLKNVNLNKIEINFNINKQNHSESIKSRCYSTRVISQDNDVEVKVTTSEQYKPENMIESSVSTNKRYIEEFKNLVNPVGRTGKYKLNKKFESLKKLSKKTKASVSKQHTQGKYIMHWF